MFNGDEFHPFISSRTASLTVPLPFPPHSNPSFSSDAFINPFSSSSQPVQHQESVQKKLLERDGSMDPWASDELLALLKFRSSMENWFPDFNWDHISRKLAELGYKRSAENCKEKFEEESRHFNSLSYVKNYKNIFSDFDAFYPVDNANQVKKAGVEISLDKEKPSEKQIRAELGSQDWSPCQESEEFAKKTGGKKKRKRDDKFEMFKGFCEAIVRKMLAQQEELHNKLLEDMVRRDKEIIEREEAWRKQEAERIKLEKEIQAHDEASAKVRQATIIEFLKRFTSCQDQNFASKIQDFVKVFEAHQFKTAEHEVETPYSQRMVESHQNPSSNSQIEHNAKGPKSPSTPCQSSNLAPKNSDLHSSTSALTNDQTNPSNLAQPFSTYKPFEHLESRGDIGKRWPKDEVLTLINLRCKLSTNIDEPKEGTKGPLWVRISQGMMELGYKRSAKRCKEKWENINKYFRKTKDSSKKRSMDSRTCPYFHHLNSLYSDGKQEKRVEQVD